MKRSGIINKDLSRVVAEMGHKDQLVLCDAGLPISQNIERIDLAIIKGYPKFITILKALLNDLVIEKVILAEEIKEYSPDLHKEILTELANIEIEYVSHENFKKQSKQSRAVVRSGEITPYANIILVSGVEF